MKKLLAILGSIGLTSTAASAVVACGNGGNSNVGGDKSIVVNPDIANGSYDSASKTFTAKYGSDKYQAHKMSFSLTKVVLKAENIHVVTSDGTNIDQESGLWSFWISENGANTVFEIEDSSLNEATVQIDLANHLPTVFKIAIHQDKNIVVNNIINGSYEATTTTFTAKYPSSQYSENRMRFSLANVSLSESNFNVSKRDGTKTEVKDGLWSFIVTDNTTTVHINDYLLDQGTIQINLDGYNSITFKIVIKQSKEIAINNTVANGSYNSDSKTLTAGYRSSQYSDHKMSFTINDLALNASNVVVKAVDKQVTTGWSLSTTTNTTTITIDDYHLDQATITIQDVEGYWPVTLNIVIPQDKNLVVGSVTNGGYAADTKTFTTAYGSSVYQGHEMSFVLNEVVLNANNIVVKNSQGTITTNGWSFTTSDENTTITINDYNLNEATITIQNVEGYWPIVFNININQDKNVFVNPDVRNGNYDDTNKMFTAKYGSSKYDDNHLLFSLKDLVATEQKIVVKDVEGQVITQASNRWSFWIADDGASTVVEIKDSNMNGATITIKGIEGYWPVTFKVAITQDKHVVVEDVTNGNYNETTKTFTAKYGNSTYQEDGHEMSFKIKGLALEGEDFVLVRSDSGEEITTGWEATISGNDTIITINDYNLNDTKVIIQNVDGYWPSVFNVVIPQDQIFSPNVTNGSYDTSTNTLTAKYGNSTYQEVGHEMSFTLSGVTLSADNIVVNNREGTTITSGWNFTTSDENTTITINDYNLNEATITIKGIEGYWPIVLKLVIPQDQNVVVNADVSKGKYDESSKSLIADYSGVEYDANHMIFSIRDIVLSEQNIIVKDSEGKVIELSSDLWSFWFSGSNTVFEIKDASLNGATIEIKDVAGYWPVTLNIVID